MGTPSQPKARKTSTATATVAEERPTVDALRQRMRGAVLLPGEDGYDEARSLFNAMLDRKPAYIARCEGAADVIQALQFGRAHGLPISVRGGGHGVAGHAVVEGGMLIDLSRMRSVRVDPEKKTVRAEGGVIFRELDHETQAHGLATTGGTISETGIAGLTLGGGVGWLARKYGLTCDNLLSADVVLADGRLVTASAAKNKDLFWALRGGGGNFGIVTSFEYRLHPVSIVNGGLILYPVEQARDLLRVHREVFAKASDDLEMLAVFMDAPPAPFIPPDWHGKPMICLAGGHFGTPQQAEEELRPYRDLGPVVDFISPMPYGVLQTMLDGAAPHGQQNYWKSTNLRALDDAAIEALLTANAGRPHPFSALQIIPLGGAASRVPVDETAFPHRNVPFLIHVVGMWGDPADNAKNIAWARDTWTALQPSSSGGAYLNFINDDMKDDVRGGYGANYERLASIKAKYDPQNVFSANQNIPPQK